MREWKRYITSSVYGLLTLAQIILWLVGYQVDGLEGVRYVGWAVWCLSAIFGWLPIFTLRQKGGVPEGKAYVHTTTLVNTGIYGLVRHPQYLAGLLLNFAVILVAQHWLIAALGVPAMVLMYWDILKADQEGLEKFGDEYRQYVETVPRVNFVAGMVRWMRRKGETQPPG